MVRSTRQPRIRRDRTIAIATPTGTWTNTAAAENAAVLRRACQNTWSLNSSRKLRNPT